MLNKVFPVFILLFSFHFLNLKAEKQVSFSEVKAAIIHQLCEEITWPDEQEWTEFNIAFYGLNSGTKGYFDRPHLVVKGLEVKTLTINDLEDLPSVQVLIVSSSLSTSLDEVVRNIEHKKILLITEGSDDLKNVMLNITKNEKLFGYEVNRSNIIIEGLDINPNLLLPNGTEVDIRQLYREIKEDLRSEKEAVSFQKQLLLKQERTIIEHKKEMVKLKKHSNALNTNINSRATELEELLETIKEKESLLRNKQIEFDSQLIHFKELERQVNLQQSLIDIKTRTLDSLENAAFRQRAYINKQSLNLSVKEDLINTQRSAIYLIGGLVFVILILLIISYRAYRSKGLIADELTSTVKKLNKQYVDNLTLNGKLIELNEKLELKVSERTEGLKEREKQLSEYTFINSHLLRAPLSKILGLAELLNVEEDDENEFIIHALKESADELDSVVREINRLLSENGELDRETLEGLINKKF